MAIDRSYYWVLKDIHCISTTTTHKPSKFGLHSVSAAISISTIKMQTRSSRRLSFSPVEDELPFAEIQVTRNHNWNKNLSPSLCARLHVWSKLLKTFRQNTVIRSEYLEIHISNTGSVPKCRHGCHSYD